MNDANIIEYLKTGNYSKASEKLYSYYPVIKKLILKNSGTKQDAEDVFQEALIILFNKINSSDFVLTSKLNTYLYSVCRLLWNDRLKQKNKVVEVDIKNELTLTDYSFIDLEEDLVKPKLAEKAFNSLGKICKEILILFYYKKSSMKEIAEKFGFKTEKVAKNQKYRCIEKAKQIVLNSSIEF